MIKNQTVSFYIFLSLLLGGLLGSFVPEASPYLEWMGTAFKLSLNMIVMPIVLTSIICGFEGIGDLKHLRRLGKYTLSFFLITTVIAVVIGLFLVNAIKPGQREPSAQVVSLIEQEPWQGSIATGNAISKKLIDQNLISGEKKDVENLFAGISAIAIANKKEDELKNKITKYIGSFELRSRLSGNNMSAIPPKAPTMSEFLHDQLENSLKNPFEALAKQRVLAVIVFAIFFGIAMTSIGQSNKVFFDVNRAINLACIKIIEKIMLFAPFGVLGLITSVVAATGPKVFFELSFYALSVVLGLLIQLLIVFPIINFVITKQRPKEFLSKVKKVIAMAFSTSSSTATLPISIETAEKSFNVNTSISKFVIPLGATINMNGSALYEAVAAVFIAQLYGIHLDFFGQLIIVFTAVLAAIGTAGIPAAATITMAVILSAAGLPLEGIGLILALDRPLDMCRTVVNVVGDVMCSHSIHHIFIKRPKNFA